MNQLVASGLNVNTNRLHLAGFSNGRSMTHFMASRTNHPFAAFAIMESGTAGGTFYREPYDRSAPDTGTNLQANVPLPWAPRPVMLRNLATSVPWVFEGRGPQRRPRHNVSRWMQVNGYGAPATNGLGVIEPPPTALRTTTNWTAAGNARARVACLDIGPGHNWPTNPVLNGWSLSDAQRFPYDPGRHQPNEQSPAPMCAPEPAAHALARPRFADDARPRGFRHVDHGSLALRTGEPRQRSQLRQSERRRPLTAKRRGQTPLRCQLGGVALLRRALNLKSRLSHAPSLTLIREISMKTKSTIHPLPCAALGLLLLSTLNPQLSTAFAQGTAFTYQGRLNNGDNPANGSYDLTFALFGVSSGGGAVAGPLTNAATAVSNGLFSVVLNFGATFPGADRWLEIGVRTNGGGAFTALAPRQKLAATPYAITSGNLTGSLPAGQVTGTMGVASLPTGGDWALTSPLTLDTNTLTIDPGNNRVGIGLTNPASKLHVDGVVKADSNSTEAFEVGGLGAGYALLDRALGAAGRWSMYAVNGRLSWYGNGTDRMTVTSAGDVGIGTTFPSEKLHVIGNILANGTVTGGSDRNAKENFAAVNPQEVLAKVAALPIQRWNYIGEMTPHIGPVAQDFHGAFQVGMDDKHISMVDADGVALAAIQGLNQRLTDELKRRDAENAELRKDLSEIKRLLTTLSAKGNQP